MITVYDFPMARLVDKSPAEMILVGDSLGMVIQGLEHTNPVTLDEIIYHAKAVRRGAPNTLIVGDMPFMSYQVGPEQALMSAGRIIKESAADCVKMEGGRYVPIGGKDCAGRHPCDRSHRPDTAERIRTGRI